MRKKHYKGFKLSIVTLIIFSMIFTLQPYKYVQAIVDGEGPVINNITLDKKQVERGEKITITIDATDESGVERIEMLYQAQGGGQLKTIKITPDKVTGELTGYITIGKDDVEGVWKLLSFIAYDNKGNYTTVSAASTIMRNAYYEVVGEHVDGEGPVLKGLTLDKNEVQRGEKIKVTVDAIDESGVDRVKITYQSPAGNSFKDITIKPNTETGELIGYIDISSKDMEGIWKAITVYLYDKKGNYRIEWSDNEILKKASYQVKGEHIDGEGPSIKSVTLDKRKVERGEKIKVSIDAIDESGVDYIKLSYISPNRSKFKDLDLNLESETGKFVGYIKINSDDATGMWNFFSLNAFDKKGNVSRISEDDPIAKDFYYEVIDSEPIEPLNVPYTTVDEFWTNKVINGDLYVGPKSTLTINGDVTINGNIYVLGELKNYGNLNVNGNIYAYRMFTSDSVLFNNGVFYMLGGTSNIKDVISSQYPFDVPFKIYNSTENNELFTDGDKLTITGAILPVVDLYINYNKVDVRNDGTFKVDIDTTKGGMIEFEIVDSLGHMKKVSYTLINKYDVNNDGKIDLLDLATMSNSYNSKKGQANWKSRLDFNNDGIIDIYDIVVLARMIK